MNCENIFYSQQTEISKLMSGELIKKQKKDLAYLQSLNVHRQAYHSNCFIGNYVQKMVKVIFNKKCI